MYLIGYANLGIFQMILNHDCITHLNLPHFSSCGLINVIVVLIDINYG